MSRGSDFRFLAGGIVALTVATGIGRFAYTPILPWMRAEAGLSQTMAGFVASANFAGYLLGALASSRSAWRESRVVLLRWSMAVSVATLLLMAVQSAPAWLALRFIAGFAAGFVFVLASTLVLERSVQRGRPIWVALFYGGVGLGIALSGALVPLFGAAFGWRGTWLGLGVLSAAACALTTGGLTASGAYVAPRVQHGDVKAPATFWWLFAAYGLEGIAYSIPATFMVAMFAAAPALAPWANSSWVLVGLVGIPSTFVWNQFGVRVGRGRALTLALALQCVGIAAPLYSPNAAGALLCAVALGGTFMGITAVTNALGLEIDGARSLVSIGRLTTVFGLGQIFGPLIATALANRTGNYAGSLLAASAILVVSTLLMARVAAGAGRA